VIVTPGSEYLRTLIASLANVLKRSSRTGDSRHRQYAPGHYGWRKAALDINLVDPALPEPEYNKISTAADLIARIYHDTEKWKSVQLVFSDLGTPAARSGTKTNGARNRRKIHRDRWSDRPAVQDEDVVPQTTVAKEVIWGR